MTQSDFEAGPEFTAALRVLTDNLPDGELVAAVLGDLQSRVKALEKRDGGWRKT